MRYSKISFQFVLFPNLLVFIRTRCSQFVKPCCHLLEVYCSCLYEDKTLHGIEEKPMKELSAPFVRECTNVCGEQINAIPLLVFMVMMMDAMLTKGCDLSLCWCSGR